MKAKTKITTSVLSILLGAVFAFVVGVTFALDSFRYDFSNGDSVSAYLANKNVVVVNDTTNNPIPYGTSGKNTNLSLLCSVDFDFDVRIKYHLAWSDSSLSTDNVVLDFVDRDNWLVDENYIFSANPITNCNQTTKTKTVLNHITFTDTNNADYVGKTLKIIIDSVDFAYSNSSDLAVENGTTLNTPASNAFANAKQNRTVTTKKVVQLLDKTQLTTRTFENGAVTYTNNYDGTVTVNGTATTESTNYSLQTVNIKSGHKYYMSCKGVSTDDFHFQIYCPNNVLPSCSANTTEGYITGAATADGLGYLQVKLKAGKTVNNITFTPQLFDLTAMYGSGNEPTTADQFKADYGTRYYDFQLASSSDSLKSTTVEQILDRTKYPATNTRDGVTYTNNGDGTINVNGTNTSANRSGYAVQIVTNAIPGHKFLAIGCPAGGSTSTYNLYVDCYKDSTWLKLFYETGSGLIFTVPDTTTKINFYIETYKGATINNLVFKPQLIDLTAMYGTGNEPNSLSEFQADFGAGLYDYRQTTYAKAQTKPQVVQLFDYSDFAATREVAGVKFTNNGDGTITINGTATDTIWFPYVSYATLTSKILSKCKTHIVAYRKNSGEDSLYFYLPTKISGKVYAENVAKPSAGKTIDLSKQDIDSIAAYIYISSGETYKNLTIKPELFDLTEMYGAGNEPTISEFNKQFPSNEINIANLKTKTVNGVTFTNNNDGTISMSGTSTAGEIYYDFPKTTNNHKYLLTGYPSDSAITGLSLYWNYYKTDGSYGGGSSVQTKNGIVFDLTNIEYKSVNIGLTITKTGVVTDGLIFAPTLIDLTAYGLTSITSASGLSLQQPIVPFVYEYTTGMADSVAYVVVNNYRNKTDNGIAHPGIDTARLRTLSSDGTTVADAQRLFGEKFYAGVGAMIVAKDRPVYISMKITALWRTNNPNETGSKTEDNIQLNYTSDWTHAKDSDNNFVYDGLVGEYLFNYYIPANTTRYVNILESIEITSASAVQDFGTYKAVVSCVEINATKFNFSDSSSIYMGKEIYESTQTFDSSTTALSGNGVTVLNSSAFERNLFYVGATGEATQQNYQTDITITNNTSATKTVGISYSLRYRIGNGQTFLKDPDTGNRGTSFSGNVFYEYVGTTTSNFSVTKGISSVSIAPYSSITFATRFSVNAGLFSSSIKSTYGIRDIWVELVPTITQSSATTATNLSVEYVQNGNNLDLYLVNNSNFGVVGATISDLDISYLTETYSPVSTKPVDWDVCYFNYYSLSNGVYSKLTTPTTFVANSFYSKSTTFSTSSVSTASANGFAKSGSTFTNASIKLGAFDKIKFATVSGVNFSNKNVAVHANAKGTTFSNSAGVVVINSGSKDAVVANYGTEACFVYFEGTTSSADFGTTTISGKTCSYYKGVLRPGQVMELPMTSTTRVEIKTVSAVDVDSWTEIPSKLS